MGDVLSRQIMDDWKRMQDKIRENINRKEIARIVKERFNLDVDDDAIDVRQGKSVNYKGEPVLELDLRISHAISVRIDDDGNYAIPEEAEPTPELTPEERIDQTGEEVGASFSGFEPK